MFDLKKKIAAWRSKIGRDEAEKRLKKAGLSLSIRQKLLAGTYDHEPNGLTMKAIDSALKAPA